MYKVEINGVVFTLTAKEMASKSGKGLVIKHVLEVM